jgi:hypothetical protein
VRRTRSVSVKIATVKGHQGDIGEPAGDRSEALAQKVHIFFFSVLTVARGGAYIRPTTRAARRWRQIRLLL